MDHVISNFFYAPSIESAKCWSLTESPLKLQDIQVLLIMGQCCTKCILSHTCCLCFCGFCSQYITGDFKKENVLNGKSGAIASLKSKETKTMTIMIAGF